MESSERNIGQAPPLDKALLTTVDLDRRRSEKFFEAPMAPSSGSDAGTEKTAQEDVSLRGILYGAGNGQRPPSPPISPIRTVGAVRNGRHESITTFDLRTAAAAPPLPPPDHPWAVEGRKRKETGGRTFFRSQSKQRNPRFSHDESFKRRSSDKKSPMLRRNSWIARSMVFAVRTGSRRKRKLAERIHLTLEHPERYYLGRVLVLFITFLILLSLLILILSSEHSWLEFSDRCKALGCEPADAQSTAALDDRRLRKEACHDCAPEVPDAFFHISLGIYVIFTLDFLVRVGTAHADVALDKRRNQLKLLPNTRKPVVPFLPFLRRNSTGSDDRSTPENEESSSGATSSPNQDGGSPVEDAAADLQLGQVRSQRLHGKRATRSKSEDNASEASPDAPSNIPESPTQGGNHAGGKGGNRTGSMRPSAKAYWAPATPEQQERKQLPPGTLNESMDDGERPLAPKSQPAAGPPAPARGARGRYSVSGINLKVLHPALFSPRDSTLTVKLRRTWRYVNQPLNVIDIVVLATFYLGWLLELPILYNALTVLRIFRVAVGMRVMELRRVNQALKLFTSVNEHTMSALTVLLTYLTFVVFMFGTIVYFAERGKWDPATGWYMRPALEPDQPDEPTPYSSIHQTFWWVIATLSTVGYGEMVPHTNLGRTVGGFVMVLGVMFVALPISIMGQVFNIRFEEIRAVEQKKKQKKRRAQLTLAGLTARTDYMPLKNAWYKWKNFAEQRRREMEDLPGIIRQEVRVIRQEIQQAMGAPVVDADDGPQDDRTAMSMMALLAAQNQELVGLVRNLSDELGTLRSEVGQLRGGREDDGGA